MFCKLSFCGCFVTFNFAICQNRFFFHQLYQKSTGQGSRKVSNLCSAKIATDEEKSLGSFHRPKKVSNHKQCKFLESFFSYTFRNKIMTLLIFAHYMTLSFSKKLRIRANVRCKSCFTSIGNSGNSSVLSLL